MRNIKLLIEYEGTAYCGWQWQRGLPTVQGALIEAIRKLIGEEVEVSGSSRTDAGVHALGQVANFKTASGISLYNIQRGLNFHLPDDITIRQVEEVLPEFDSRHDSKGKTYIYRIVNRPQRPAMMRNIAWHVWRPLDIGLMAEAASHFIGEKDFASFMAADAQVSHSMREVTSVDIRRGDNDLVEIEVKGTAFLRHMVRIMAGTLVEVGMGRLRPEAVQHIIAAQDRRRAPMTAPPHGLTLVKVEY
ncbi:MAG: tRNA pseudouridine(38-40) synthase TruA [Deltaproteobacteria bacterium]|nr:tRNA pseudouridine(38-40) synthase TruA [Deltaproteobacteria bacterium]